MSSQTRLLQVQRWQRQLYCNELQDSFLEVAAAAWKERQKVPRSVGENRLTGLRGLQDTNIHEHE